MIDKQVLDRFEDAIGYFEDNWSPNSRDRIQDILQEYCPHDVAALTEMIRIDIELRYRHGIPLPIEHYIEQFDELRSIPVSLAEVAFEDYRSRVAFGYPISPSRWEDLPEIDNQLWFQQLKLQNDRDDSSPAPASRVSADKFRVIPGASCDLESELKQIGFELVNRIGSGNFSNVYLATQIELADRYVVLKVVEEALQEPESMAMLQHTNIVPIYSFHRIRSGSVICMPYTGSVTLARYFSDDPNRNGQSLVNTVVNGANDTLEIKDDQWVPPTSENKTRSPAANENAVLKTLDELQDFDCNDLALWMFQRIVSALAHSHAREILHGDLKPANILIRNDGEPALLDFNLSHVIDGRQSKRVGGTLPYMAPETYRSLVARGPSVAEASADIYSVGVILFEFLTGRLPYTAPASPAPMDLEPAIAERKNSPRWDDSDDVSLSLRAIVNKCIQFDPADRYSSAESLRDDIERERNNLPLLHANEPIRYRATKWVRRHPTLASGTTMGLLAFIAIIAASAYGVRLRNQTQQLASSITLDSFVESSTESLATLMVDPARNTRESIDRAYAPLEEFGILGDKPEHKLNVDQLSESQKRFYRDIAWRHVGQIAIHEAARLETTKKSGSYQAQDSQFLDELIEAAKRLSTYADSRALAFLMSQRAFLDDDTSEFARLQEVADKRKTESDTEIYLEAVRLLSNRRQKEARELLVSLSENTDIPSALWWTSLGWSQFQSNDFEGAKLSFTQSLERAPESAALYRLRALCYMQLRESDRGEADLDRAIELQPTAGLYMNRGLARENRLNLEGAIEDYTTGLTLAPDHAQLLLMRSRVYRRRGQIRKARMDFEKALDLDNQSVPSLIARSKARRDNDPEGALHDLELVLEQDPTNTVALTSMAYLLVKMGRTVASIEMLKKISEIAPDRQTPYITRAVYLARLDRRDEAKQEMDQALSQPAEPKIWYQAACVHALLDEPEQALRCLNYALLNGYGSDEVLTDKDLDSLRELPEFKDVEHMVLTARNTADATGKKKNTP